MLGLRKEICEGHLGGGVHAILGIIITKAITRGLSGEEIWSLCACILPSPTRCPICCEILDPLGFVRLEGGGYISEYKLAFPEMAWDVGYLTHLCFHPHLIRPTRAEWTSVVKGETVLDRVVFWFGSADRQVKTCQSPFFLWDLAGKALLTPVRKEVEWQYKCFIEWKYQKYRVPRIL